MIIARSAVNEFIDAERDDWRWLKKVPKRELVAAYRQWKVRPHFVTPPWTHQLAAFHAGMQNNEFLFLFDMGAGKTKIGIDLYMQREREKDVTRGLVLTPRALVSEGWRVAGVTHGEIEVKAITASVIEEKWEALLTHDKGLASIDVQSFVLATTTKGLVKKGLKQVPGRVRDDKKLAKLQKRYPFLLIDEIHKLKNRDSLWWSCVQYLAKTTMYRYGFTGTLFGRSPEDAWAQMRILDQGATFGQHIGLFHAAFFNTKVDDWGIQTREFNTLRMREFSRMLQHRSLTYGEHELVELPPRVETTVTVPFSEDAREHYLRALEGVISAEGKLKELDSQWLRMRQISSGYIAWQDDTGKHLVEMPFVPKMERMAALVDTATASGKVVICYDYTHTGERIVARMKKEGYATAWIYGGCKDPVAEKRKFVEDPRVQVLVMNSEAGGTGVDGLQDVASVLIFYESPTSPITRIQTIKRVHRPGAKRRVFIYDLVTRGSVDVKIVDFAKAGKSLHDAVLAARGGGVKSLLT